MKSHARKQLLYWPLCCGGGTKSSVDRSAVVWESKEEAEEEETRKLNYRRLRLLHESGEGEPQPMGRAKEEGLKRHKRKSSCLPRGFILACWGRGGMYGVTERSGFELFSTFWFGEVFPSLFRRLHFPPTPSPFVASETDDQNILLHFGSYMWYPPD